MQSIISLKDYKISQAIVLKDGKLFLTLNNNNNSFFLYVPKEIKVSFINNNLVCFYSMEDLSVYNTFFQNLVRLTNQDTFLYKKKLLLKGLGFRLNIDDNKTLIFKLGFSHLISLVVPEYITSVRIKKNTLLLESSNNALLGNFVKEIERLKPCDSYKEKGFCVPNAKKKLKPIKKK